MDFESKKVLFIGDCNPNGYIYLRSQSIKRLVKKIDLIDINQHINPSDRLKYSLAYRFQLRLFLKNLNNAIINKINEDAYDLIWFDKPIFILEETLRIIYRMGIKTVSYNMDNPFGPRDDGCWNLYLQNIKNFTYHIISRRSDYKNLKNMNARDIIYMPFHYEKTLHFKEKNIKKELDVTFIGTPHDNRIEFIDHLARDLETSIHVFSAEWRKFKKRLGSRSNVIINDAIYKSEYRSVINKSKIMLGFITQSNLDDLSNRSFEITACGSFLLSPRSPLQERIFRENIEAVYFDDIHDCVSKVDYFLANPEERENIASAGHKRSLELGINTDFVVKRVLLKIFK